MYTMTFPHMTHPEYHLRSHAPLLLIVYRTRYLKYYTSTHIMNTELIFLYTHMQNSYRTSVPQDTYIPCAHKIALSEDCCKCSDNCTVCDLGAA